MKASDIKKGDQFTYNGEPVWTAQDDAVLMPGFIEVRVQFHPDGGIGFRHWDKDIDFLGIEGVTIVRPT